MIRDKRGLQGLEDAAGASEVFVIESVAKATGGVSPCFLYRGRPAESPQRACKRRNTGSTSHQGRHEEDVQLVPDCGSAAGQGEGADADGLITLYISFEEASPSPKLRSGAAPGQPEAPYRVCLEDASGELLLSYRGLPTKVYTDERRRLVRWGPLGIRFPSAPDLRHFAACLRRVELAPCDLSAPPPAPRLRPAPAAPRPIPPPPAWPRLAAAMAGGPAAAAPALQRSLALRFEAAAAPIPISRPRPAVGNGAGAAPPRPFRQAPVQWQQPQPEQLAADLEPLPCTPPTLGAAWAFPALDLPPLATPPPLNRCAQSGDAGCDCHRLAAGPLPNPVPFSLLLPLQQQPQGSASLGAGHPPSDAVAAAIALLEADVAAARW